MSIMLFGTCPCGEEIFRRCSVKLPLTCEDKKCLVSSLTNNIHGQLTVSWSRSLPYLDGGGKRIHVTNHYILRSYFVKNVLNNYILG